MKGYSWQNNRKKLLAIRNRYVIEQDLVQTDVGFDQDQIFGGDACNVETFYEDGSTIEIFVNEHVSHVVVLLPKGGKTYLYKEEK